jgi:Pyruvate/2-oxoacid:ferredoxin oxidoreductase delta subunit
MLSSNQTGLNCEQIAGLWQSDQHCSVCVLFCAAGAIEEEEDDEL